MPTTTRDRLLANEVPDAAVPPATVRLASQTLCRLFDAFEVQRWPALRWARRTGLDGAVVAVPGSTRRELWLNPDQPPARLVGTAAHEARHVQQREAGRFDHAANETDAEAFALLVERRFCDGLPIVGALLPALPAALTTERRSVLPPTTRAASSSTAVASPARRHGRLPVMKGGQVHFRCHACGVLVAVGILHHCDLGLRRRLDARRRGVIDGDD